MLFAVYCLLPVEVCNLMAVVRGLLSIACGLVVWFSVVCCVLLVVWCPLCVVER